MCGIFGCVGRTPETDRLMPFLAWEMDNRGRDSWGVTDGLRIYKKMGSILKSFLLPQWGDSLIYHTRSASVGSKCLDNQHPFVFPKFAENSSTKISTLVGVHNGGIYNHEDLDKKYDRKFAVDSMHVYAHLAAGLPVSELRGYGALAWFETFVETKHAEIHFAVFNMQDFHVFRLKNGSLVFCSTMFPVIDAASMCRVAIDFEYDLKQDTLYSVRCDSQASGAPEYTLMRTSKLLFGGRYKPVASSKSSWCTKCYSHSCTCSPTPPYNPISKFPYSTGSTLHDPALISKDLRDANKCAFCKNVVIDRTKELVCGVCLKILESRSGNFLYV